MIIRKPYAFLIKNFKKIHIVLLLLSLFVVYKILNVIDFINEFTRLGIYDYFNNPVTKHISVTLEIALILLVVGSAAILFLLRYKQKSWKLYLIPIIEYFALYLVLNMIKGFFSVYNSTVQATDVRLSRDLLFIFAFTQIPTIVVLVMRVFGLGRFKIDFSHDQEFLELSESDREEIEISLDIDKNSFKRLYRKLLRNISYFYTEHRIICIVIATVIVVGAGFNIYKHVFVTNRSYSEGEIYSANGYTLRINKVYFTDKDYAGKVITKKSNFVIVDVAVKNNSSPRTIKMENFHIKNGTKDYVSTRKTYEKEFIDLGTTYNVVKELRRDEETNFIIVFKVDKDLDKDKFVMFYQENDGYLRKIKINVQDISKIEKPKDLSVDDSLKLNVVSKPDTVNIEDIELTDFIEYSTKGCTTDMCVSSENQLYSDGSYHILTISFGSDLYDGLEMLDFLKRHGKILYKTADNDDEEIAVESVINKKYYGKYVFLKLPSEVTAETKLTLNLVIRNKEYNWKLN